MVEIKGRQIELVSSNPARQFRAATNHIQLPSLYAVVQLTDGTSVFNFVVSLLEIDLNKEAFAKRIAAKADAEFDAYLAGAISEREQL